MEKFPVRLLYTKTSELRLLSTSKTTVKQKNEPCAENVSKIHNKKHT